MKFRYLIPTKSKNSVKFCRNSFVRNSAGHSRYTYVYDLRSSLSILQNPEAPGAQAEPGAGVPSLLLLRGPALLPAGGGRAGGLLLRLGAAGLPGAPLQPGGRGRSHQVHHDGTIGGVEPACRQKVNKKPTRSHFMLNFE